MGLQVVSNIIFYPRKIAIPNDLKPNTEILRLNIGNDIEIGGFFYKNDVKNPTILLFHGNGEIAFDYQHIESKQSKKVISTVQKGNFC